MSTHTFNPPDHELIGYLNKKITEEGDLGAETEINEVNICSHEPAEIPALARMQSNHTWHIISPVEKLNGKCQRTKRSSKTGNWKITGKNSMVKDIDGNIIGFKKVLVFMLKNKKSSASSSSSSSSSSSTGRLQNKYVWIIHEFHSSIQHPNKDAFVLCKLMKKTRAPMRDVVVEASSTAAETDPLITPNQMLKDNNHVEDYGGDKWGDFENIFLEFQSTELLDQPHYSDYSYYSQNLEIDGNW